VQGRPALLDSAHSTDANLPMSLGIPAITMSGGGVSGGYHSEKLEWWSPPTPTPRRKMCC
jgi:hypothetical protein